MPQGLLRGEQGESGACSVVTSSLNMTPPYHSMTASWWWSLWWMAALQSSRYVSSASFPKGQGSLSVSLMGHPPAIHAPRQNPPMRTIHVRGTRHAAPLPRLSRFLSCPKCCAVHQAEVLDSVRRSRGGGVEEGEGALEVNHDDPICPAHRPKAASAMAAHLSSIAEEPPGHTSKAESFRTQAKVRLPVDHRRP